MSSEGNGHNPDSTVLNGAARSSPAARASDVPKTTRLQAFRRKWLGINKEGRDPRYLALRNFSLSLTVFNLVGFPFLGLEQPFLFPFLALATSYSVELILETLAAWAYRRPAAYRGNGLRGLVIFLLPAHITGLTLDFLVYSADRFVPVMCAITIAVGTKWVLRAKINGKVRHFMNPSNFGICVALLSFPLFSMVGPYHFVETLYGPADALIVVGLLAGGTMLNSKLTKRMPLIMAWLSSFVLQGVVRGLLDSDTSIIAALLPMTGLAFVLFTNYMITDPATTPFRPRDQIAFGASVGTCYGVLMALHTPFSLVFALVIVCGCRGVFWWSRNIREWLAARAAATVVQAQPVTEPGKHAVTV